MLFKIIILFFLLLQLSEAKPEAQRRCGRYLIRFLGELCNGPCSGVSSVDIATIACATAVPIEDLKNMCCPNL
ncbi:INSulin related [Caenorhabditis elegans]|uniref:INSulin related n=1 Tax=Caenorhabditis elegans TaxID=6239 RepID=Q7JKN0_CAEEL|nr:INSulin related [Caenorhabditis elegans]CAE53733.1 INSulin related [Caenorhabditis elegans]|eukprot:NP_001021849.1 INSulin related [Caenorhabditis elegans]